MATGPAGAVGPRQRIEAECLRRGPSGVVDGCIALLRGGTVDPELLLALGGPGATAFVTGPTRAGDYWLRVWGARGLLWTWEERAAPAIRAALGDESWRVREMSLKVIARHGVDELLEAAVAAADDPVARVRAAAARAVRALTAGSPRS